jgi:hypothetical protein
VTYYLTYVHAACWCSTIRCYVNPKLNNDNKNLTLTKLLCSCVCVCVCVLLPWFRYLVFRKTATKYFNICKEETVYFKTELRLQRRSELSYLKIHRNGGKKSDTLTRTRNMNCFNTTRLLLFCTAGATVYFVGGLSPRSVFRLVSGRGNIIWVSAYPPPPQSFWTTWYTFKLSVHEELRRRRRAGS